MPEYIVNLWLDGYDTEEQMEKACDEFIYEQLNFTASSVKVKRSDYNALLARHNALVEAVAWEREVEWLNDLITEQYACVSEMPPEEEEISVSYFEARAEVDRLIANESAADCKGEG